MDIDNGSDNDSLSNVPLAFQTHPSMLRSFAPHHASSRPSQRLMNLHRFERSQRLITNSKLLINWESYRMPEEQINKLSRKLRQFYHAQNEQIDRFMAVDELLDGPLPLSIVHAYHGRSSHNAATLGDTEGRDSSVAESSDIDREAQPLLNHRKEDHASVSHRVVMVAIYINFFCNCLLLAAKAFVTLYSSSVSVLASLVDSLLDFMSTVIIYVATKWSMQQDWRVKYNYPVSRSRRRFEPLGVTFFGTIMIVSFCQVGLEALSRLVNTKDQSIIRLGKWSLVSMTSTVVIKFACWIWCRTIKNSTAVNALAQDAMNDVSFNIISLVFPVVGAYFELWWMDALGALLISCYICFEWFHTVLDHMRRLGGASAPPEVQRQLVYTAYRFSDLIRYVKAVNVYHAGDSMICEVDIVLDESTSLRDGHDVGESLQLAIESMVDPFIERAFVHLDYSHAEPAGHY